MPERVWTIVITALLAVVLLVAGASSWVHPHHDPPAQRDPFAGLIRSDR